MNDIKGINIDRNKSLADQYSRLDNSNSFKSNMFVEHRRMTRRGLRTSHKQYEIYISYLQNDVKFCVGTRDPTKFTQYVESTWRAIANELNQCKSGPNLAAKQWQKRFTDWKHTTRSKYRKLKNEMIKTGVDTEPNLNVFEKFALQLWGTTATRSNRKLEESHIRGSEADPMVQDNTHESHSDDINELCETEMADIKLEDDSDYDDLSDIQIPSPEVHVNEDPAPIIPKIRVRHFDNNNAAVVERNEDHHHSIENLSINLQSTRNEDAERQADTNINGVFSDIRDAVKERKNGLPKNISDGAINNLSDQISRLVDIKMKKLQFEIAKFKYMHPDFKFN